MGGWVFKNVEICNYYHYLVGGCHKKVKFSLLFVTNLWCSHFFCNFSTSQARKKGWLFFNQRQLPKACWFWKQKNVLLSRTTTLLSQQKEKNLLTSFVCFLLPSFWKLGTTNNSEKDKTKKRCFFLKGKCSLFWQQANFALNKMSRVLSFKSKLCKSRSCFSFSLCKPNESTLAFFNKKFSEKFFLFFGQSTFDKSFRKKELVLFPLAKSKDFVV